MTIKQNIFFITLLGLLVTVQGVFAETVIITNVSSSANSGGNSVSGGQIIEGEATTEVFMETIINGEVVQSVYKKETSQEGSAVIEETFTYNSENADIENSVQAVAEGGVAAIKEKLQENTAKEELTMEETATPTVLKIEEEKEGLIVNIKHFFKYVLSLFT